MSTNKTISQQISYQSHFIEVLGTKMHYIEQGEGDPILFLHGVPASSYVWRNVIPAIAPFGRCIALDLMGMGKSGKPDIEYTVFDHIRYVEAFIKALKLHNITLVMHGWGSVIGLDYAMRHENEVKALTFFEAHLKTYSDWKELSLPVQELASILKSLKKDGKELLEKSDYVIEKILPSGVMRRLSDAEMEQYRLPFKKIEDRKPLCQFLKDYPVAGQAPKVKELIDNYSQKLQSSSMPKLLLYAIPGFNTTIDTIVWAKNNLKNLTIRDMGEDLHFVQETQPETLGQQIASWYQSLFSEVVTV